MPSLRTIFISLQVAKVRKVLWVSLAHQVCLDHLAVLVFQEIKENLLVLDLSLQESQDLRYRKLIDRADAMVQGV